VSATVVNGPPLPAAISSTNCPETGVDEGSDEGRCSRVVERRLLHRGVGVGSGDRDEDRFPSGEDSVVEVDGLLERDVPHVIDRWPLVVPVELARGREIVGGHFPPASREESLVEAELLVELGLERDLSGVADGRVKAEEVELVLR
jgi:hypothetical protein